MRECFSWGLVGVLAIALVVLSVRFEVPRKLLEKAGVLPQQPWLSFEQWYFLQQKEMKEYLKGLGVRRDAIVLAGDSHARGASVYLTGLLPTKQFIFSGIYGEGVIGLNHRASDIAQIQPSEIWVMIGINDLREGRSLEEMRNNFISTMQLWNGVPITVFSVLPLGKRMPYAEKVNQQVELWNRELASLAQEHGARWVDLTSVMTEAGFLKSSLSDDELHLNLAGYQAWAKAVEALWD